MYLCTRKCYCLGGVALGYATSTRTIQGSRIINLEKLQEYINCLTVHAAQCGDDIVLTGETRAGLTSIISSWCSKCSYTVPLETFRKVKGPRGNCGWERNLAAVWGQMSTGGGHSRFQKTMGVRCKK